MRSLALLVGLLSVALVVALVRAEPLKLPAVDTSAMEPAVREQIEAERRTLAKAEERLPAGSPELAEAYGRCGRVHALYKLNDPARSCFENAARLAPADARWAYYLGALLQALGDFEAAEARLSRALELKASGDMQGATLIRLGEVRLQLSRPDEARRAFEAALPTAAAAARFGLGRVALAQGDIRAAAGHFEAALASQPGASEVRSPLAIAYRKLGRLDDARKALTGYGEGRVTFPDPLMAEVAALNTGSRRYVTAGTTALREKRFAVAAEAFRQAVAADPADSAAWAGLGVAQEGLRDLPGAEASYRKAVELDPANARAHYNLGTLLAARGDRPEGIGHLETAVRLDPESRDALFNLGQALAEAGEPARALELWDRLLKLSPQDAVARFQRARALSSLGRHDEAAAELGAVAAAAPGEVAPRAAQAQALLAAGRDADARARLEEGLARLPDSEALAQLLVRVLASSSRPEVRDGQKALEIAERLLAAGPNADREEAMALALGELGRFSEAAGHQRRALAAAGAGSPLRQRLAGCLARYERGEPCRATSPPDPLSHRPPAGREREEGFTDNDFLFNFNLLNNPHLTDVPVPVQPPSRGERVGERGMGSGGSPSPGGRGGDGRGGQGVRSPLSEHALALRNLGLAQLENDLPAEAEATFRQLAGLAPDDPLPFAGLAVAALRQQKGDDALRWIGQAQEKAPGRADLWRIRGDVFQSMDRYGEALAAYRKAVDADPQDVEAWYSLYRAAQAEAGEETEQAAAEALRELARLRPENLVALLQTGQRAVRAGDRAGATQAFLRVREILGEPPPPAAAGLEQVLAILEAGDPAAARGPAARLENVLKPTPLYQQGLREMLPIVRGTPVARFAQEPPPDRFGDPLPVRFRGASLAAGPTAGRALALGDFDGDERPDLARVTAGENPRLEIQGKAPLPVAGIEGLLAADLDNDGKLDLIGTGPGRVAFWRGRGDGTFEDATAAAGLDKATAEAAAVLDFDIEGDLDLVLAVAGNAVEVFRNALEGPLTPSGKTIPPLKLSGIRDLAASDLDRDGDLDLVLAHAGGLTWLDNQRQGRFADRTAAGGISGAGGAGAVAAIVAVTSADLDDDGLPDLIAAGDGLAAWHNRGGRFEPWPLPGLGEKGRTFTDVLAFDADNDGRLDLAATGPNVLLVLGRRGDRDRPAFERLTIEAGPPGASALAAGDLDGDGDLDLATAGAAGLHRLENLDGNRNHWLDVRLRALTQGSGKNNLQGLGSTMELRAGGAYQFREAAGGVTHFGLGRLRQADSVRVVWTNGVPQNRLRPQGDHRIVEEQVLKGSCPFLYAWDGRRFAFVTDLLWNAPLGLPVAEGVWAGAQPDELVRVDGAQPAGAAYLLRITEELWEAAWFDAVRLWVVDHPPGVEVASSLRVIPGEKNPPPSDRLLASRDPRPVTAAWDGAGHDATARVRERDEVYASGYLEGPYQGVAARPWTFTFDLGDTPGRPVRLHLDGWIFPADASLNLAAAQRRDLAYVAPRLEVETPAGWHVLIPALGHPAGKTKTMVIDTPPLPSGARRLRIVSTHWLAWDRIAWTTLPSDGEPQVRARLEPATADLRDRGFSTLVRRAPNAPHSYDYEGATRESPWLPFPGRYTRYGDVRELLLAADDRAAILAPGDEIALTFAAAGLPPVPPGWTRTVFLESHGWDKDADRNTWEAQQLEPLPFRAMSGYPYGPGERYPDTPLHREYRERWLTRER